MATKLVCRFREGDPFSFLDYLTDARVPCIYIYNIYIYIYECVHESHSCVSISACSCIHSPAQLHTSLRLSFSFRSSAFLRSFLSLSSSDFLSFPFLASASLSRCFSLRHQSPLHKADHTAKTQHNTAIQIWKWAVRGVRVLT